MIRPSRMPLESSDGYVSSADAIQHVMQEAGLNALQFQAVLEACQEGRLNLKWVHTPTLEGIRRLMLKVSCGLPVAVEVQGMLGLLLREKRQKLHDLFHAGNEHCIFCDR